MESDEREVKVEEVEEVPKWELPMDSAGAFSARDKESANGLYQSLSLCLSVCLPLTSGSILLMSVLLFK